MTYAPPTLVDLGRYWTSQGGKNLGIVGDTAHQAKGVSYHLGKDQLTATAYSRKTSRDRAGLTNGASAIDLGRLNGTLTQLRTFSVWLVGQARANKPGTSDMREIIYSPDGKVVLRWDRERGYPSKPQGGEADTSHLTHTHVSWYRDAEKRDHTTAFRPYFGPVTPEPPGGDAVAQLPITDTTPHRVDVPAPMTFYDLDGKVLSEGHSGVTDYYSPYVARETVASGKHFYAIYAESSAGITTLILTRPSTARPVESGDCGPEVTAERERIAAHEAARIKAI